MTYARSKNEVKESYSQEQPRSSIITFAVANKTSIRDLPVEMLPDMIETSMSLRGREQALFLLCWWEEVNTLRPRQNGRYFPDDIFRRIFLNEIFCILMKISLKFVPQGPINNIPALVQIMAWRRSGDKPLSEPMMAWLNDAYMRHSASISWYLALQMNGAK